jgi:hypothetical protein
MGNPSDGPREILMPIHVGELASEVSVSDGETPLSKAQLEQVVTAVIERLQQQDRDRRENHEATALRASSRPSLKAER